MTDGILGFEPTAKVAHQLPWDPSLAPLQALSLDTLKLAPSLVREARGGPAREAALEGAVALAKALGTSVVARGVERPEERSRLATLGVDRIQGPLLPSGRIDTVADVAALLSRASDSLSPLFVPDLSIVRQRGV